MTRPRPSLRAALLAAGLAFAARPAAAAYITDKLMVGVRERPEASAESARLVQGGTPVEVLRRGAAFLEVRLSDGTTGWVEARFVTDDRPATFQLLEAQARLSGLERRVVELERSGATPGRGEPAPGEAAAPLPVSQSTGGLSAWLVGPLVLLALGAGYLAGRRRP